MHFVWKCALGIGLLLGFKLHAQVDPYSLPGMGNNSALEKYSWEEILGEYSALEKLLKQSFGGTSSCNTFNPQAVANSCSFKQYCQQLGGAGAYLYESADGGKIPNYRLMELERAVAQCFNNSKIAHDLSKPVSMPAQTNMPEPYKLQAQAERTFLEAVEQAGWGQDYTKFKRASIDLMEAQLDARATGPDLLGQGPLDETRAEKIVSDIEARAKVKMPAKVRKTYIDSLLVVQRSMNYGMRPLPSLSQPENLNDKPFYGSPIKPEQADLVKKSVDRSFALYQQTIDDILDLLERKAQKDPVQKAKYEMMKERISSVGFIPSPMGDEMPRECKGGPNAFYDPTSHSLTLCPQLLELPEMALRQVIAHEIGHSIDPCNLSMKLMQGQAKGFGGGPIPYVELFEVPPSNMENITVASIGIGLKQNPMKKTIECLSSQQSIQARVAARQESLADLNKAIKQLEKSGATKENSQYYRTLISARSQFDTMFNNYGACSFLPGNSQIQEAWSDWISSEVVGERLKQMPAQARKQNAFESMSFSLAMECSRQPSAAEQKSQEFLNKMGCVEVKANKAITYAGLLLQVTAQKEDVHGHWVDRMEKLMLMQPTIRQAMECGKSDKGKYCE